jgi:hypothetical protein
MSIANNSTMPTCWALKYTDGRGFLSSSGCWLAPWIFSDREQARKAAREVRDAGLKCKPVRIKIDVRFWEVK